nr:MAG TPA: hypothetical protein [Caudoviricetes sp.]
MNNEDKDRTRCTKLYCAIIDVLDSSGCKNPTEEALSIKAIDSLLDDYLEEFRTEHPIDNSFLTIYKDYKSIFVKEAAESAVRI